MLKKIGNRYKKHHLLDWVRCKISELSSRMPSGDRLLSVNWAKRSLYLWHEFGSTWLIVKVKYLCFGSRMQIPVWLDWRILFEKHNSATLCSTITNFFCLTGGADQEQSVCQCVLRGRQGVRCQWEGGAQLSVHRGECRVIAFTQRSNICPNNRFGLQTPFGFTSHSFPLHFVSLQSCKPHKRSVCGSNDKTYRNHCELHRDACLTGLKIQVAHDGHCKGTDNKCW